MPAAVADSKRLAKMQDERADVVARMSAILDEAGDAELSADQEKEYNELEAEKASLDKRIDREEKFLAAKASTTPVVRSLAGDGSEGEGSSPRIGKVKEAADEDPKKGFKTPREFLGCVTQAGLTGRLDNRLKPLYQAAAGSDEHSTQNEGYAGFLVPEGLLPGLKTTGHDADPMAGRTTNLPMETPTVSLNSRVDKNHSSSVSGGLQVTRREETGAGTATRMQTEQITMRAHGLFGLSYASEEILMDSPTSFAALLQQGFSDEFGARLIDERLNGTGVGQYMGIMNSPATITVSKEGSQTADTINVTNVLKMRSRCWRYGDAIWLANHDTLPQLATLALASGSSVVMVYQPSSREDLPDMLFGRPIFYTEWCKTLGDKGDLVLANWSQYLEGTYEPLQSAESIHVRFLNHERTFKFWTRNAGAPWWRSALTPKNSSSTLSPFVVLEERA